MTHSCCRTVLIAVADRSYKYACARVTAKASCCGNDAFCYSECHFEAL